MNSPYLSTGFVSLEFSLIIVFSVNAFNHPASVITLIVASLNTPKEHLRLWCHRILDATIVGSAIAILVEAAH